MHSELELSGDTAYNAVGEQQQDTNKDQKRSAPPLETGYLSYMLTGVLAREKHISSQQAVFHIDNIARHEVSRPITSTGNANQAREDHRQQLRDHSQVSPMGLFLHSYKYPQEHQCRVVEFRSLCTFSGLQIMDNDAFCGHVTSEIAFQPTVGEHLTPVSCTMYLYPVKPKLTLVPASVNLYQDDLDFWNDSADTLIISAIHATHENKEMLAHGCLSATMCDESSLQSTSLKNSLHQPQCHRGLLLEDTLGCQWSGGQVFMFLKRIFHGLHIALHGGFCLVRCQLPFTESDLVQTTMQCYVARCADSAQGPVLLSGEGPAAVRAILCGRLRPICLMWRMVDCVALMAANVDRGGLLRSAMTYCCGWKKVLDTSMAALVVCVPPEDVPCAPPDVPPNIYDSIERDHNVLYCSNVFKSG